MQAAPLRGTLSCASCRQRKLKCDRNEPCSNCMTRNVDCVYAPLPRGRSSVTRGRDGNQQQLDARVRHLEQLIRTMQAAQLPGRDIVASTYDDASGSSQAHAATGSPQGKQEIELGRMISAKNNETTYVSGVHWAAIYNELAHISDYLGQSAFKKDHDTSKPIVSSNGPILLEGLQYTPCIEDVLSDIPPREAADRLVSRFFSSTEPSIVILHAPTFEQEYKRFWLDPQNCTTPWLSLLFEILTRGIFLYLRSQDNLPASITDPVATMDLFHQRASECLIISKYFSAPTLYTLEALLANIQHEFVRHRDAHLGSWVLAGVAIRLAMRMGYHRDPNDYPQISVFQGEMRRRVWAIILQLDILTSYQLGLPSMVQGSHCDTKLPHNLLDEDFGPDSIRLPQPRPNTELTPTLYTIVKAQLLVTLRDVFNCVSLGTIEGYQEILALDRRLQSAHENLPPRFQMTSPEDAITLPVHLLIRRYNIELLYQKTRCILHRHHMTKAYRDSQYNFSRSTCVEAAMTILTHQANILREVQVGGRLYRDKWFLSSLEQHDFLLASMIVCLELNFRVREQGPSTGEQDEKTYLTFTQNDLIESLRDSQRFWNELKAGSSEAQQAFDILSVMLEKVDGTFEARTHEQHQNLPIEGNFENLNIVPQFGNVNTDQTAGFVGFQPPLHATQSTHPTFSPNLDDIGSFLSGPEIVDWDLWEAFIQNARTTEDT